jgi:hypothetical protein
MTVYQDRHHYDAAPSRLASLNAPGHVAVEASGGGWRATDQLSGTQAWDADKDQAIRVLVRLLDDAQRHKRPSPP